MYKNTKQIDAKISKTSSNCNLRPKYSDSINVTNMTISEDSPLSRSLFVYIDKIFLSTDIVLNET